MSNSEKSTRTGIALVLLSALSLVILTANSPADNVSDGLSTYRSMFYSL